MVPFVKIAKKDQTALRAEAEELLASAEPDTTTRSVAFKA